MNVVIIEDEQLAAQKLSRILKEVERDIEIQGILPSIEKAVSFLNNATNTDLIFMDIQLEDGICFDIFEATNIETPVIFTTAFDEFTLKAFKQNSIDYLLKPIKNEELKNAISKYKKIHQKLDVLNLQKVITNIMTTEYKERFLIKVGEHYKSIETKSITCFYVEDGYSFIRTAENRNYGIDYSLDKIEELVDPKSFFRISRNFIIQIDSIENIVAYTTNRLKIKVKGFNENQDLIVSRERVKAFKNWMDR